MEFFGVGDDEYSRSMMYLVELHRRASEAIVQKYSGTDRHLTPNSDLLSMTIYALAHFVYWYSEHAVVIADIQGVFLVGLCR